MILKLEALILAGGESRRMGGGEKGLLPLAGKPMISHLIDRIRGRVNRVWISCREDQQGYLGYGDGVLTDLGDSLGPLTGISRALGYLAGSHLLVIPCDTPLVSGAFLDRMIALSERSPERIIVAQDGDYLQTLHMIVPRSLAPSLDAFRASGQRAVRGWLEQQGYLECRSEHAQEFLNINTPEALAEAETYLRSHDI